jgi:hypothetical protein
MERQSNINARVGSFKPIKAEPLPLKVVLANEVMLTSNFSSALNVDTIRTIIWRVYCEFATGPGQKTDRLPVRIHLQPA